MWRHVVVWTDVLEEGIASIFRVKKSASEEPACSEMSVHTRTTRRHIPENGILNSHRCENLESFNTIDKEVHYWVLFKVTELLFISSQLNFHKIFFCEWHYPDI
jgi:hypothetical protein